MPRQVTPSRRKFRIAKVFAKELQKIYGNSLKAVFAVGSVAANMALPESDIDLVVVFSRTTPMKDWENEINALKLRSEFKAKAATEVNTALLENAIFESLATKPILPISLKPIIEALSHGAVPIFGSKEYLQSLKGKAYNLPSFDGIKARERYLKNVNERTTFKHSKKGRQRFLPR